MLDVTDLRGGYGDTQVLFDVHLRVGRGQIVGLLGRNGMGKTTTIKTIFGLVRATGGDITFDGKTIFNAPSFRIARRGLALAPEGRQIFPLLTVEENLLAVERPSVRGTATWTLAKVRDLFPRLAQRWGNYGNQLSGGEQQMLAIGRALVMNPELLVLDEATEGLAPIVRDDIWAALGHLKEGGQSILVVDGRLRELLALADHAFILEKGRTVWSGSAQELRASDEIQNTYLGVG